MLRVTRGDVDECGGFLSALSQVSAQYLHEIVKKDISWQPSDPPDRLIVHKAPHLDDYFAEMLFRVSMDRETRRREFLEMALYAEDDSSARVQWPSAAVFGIGSGKPCAEHAQYLFDEHLSTGGRMSDSCAGLVAGRCFRELPQSLARVLAEVGVIDSAGGAHPLHLNNLLKTCHMVQYSFGSTASDRRMSGKLADHWKRAVVNALIASVVYCLEAGVDITDAARVKRDMRSVFDRFAATSPYRTWAHHDEVLQRLRGLVASAELILRTAHLSVRGEDVPQLLVAPFMFVAAHEAWGAEIAHFLMLHFWESELLKDIHFRRVAALLAQCFEDKNRPKVAYGQDFSIAAAVLHDRKFTGRMAVQVGPKRVEREAKYPSSLWIMSCRHNNFIVQPNKAMLGYLTEHNFGVGLVFCQNTKDMTKVLFQGRHLPHDFWNALVSRIQESEPGLWYRPTATAPFVLNGNAAHQYLEASSLTLGRLARLCQTVR